MTRYRIEAPGQQVVEGECKAAVAEALRRARENEEAPEGEGPR